MNLARLDLNLLVTLDALLQQRSVTRAAEQMGLSQPAVSAQLARLRRHFGDELLTRTGNQYRLTPLAAQLAERVRVALTGVERVFAAEPHFDPATATREFSMLISDYSVAVLGGAIGELFAAEAPGCRLRFSANTPRAIDAVEQILVTTDLLLLPHGFVEGLSYDDLYSDEWACLVSADNDDVGEVLTVRQLQTMPWVAAFHGPTASTSAARQMRILGIEPHVQVATETFLTVPTMVSGSKRVALYPRLLADRLPAELGVRALACPFPASPLREAMWWHPMHDGDPEHRYLRDLILRAVDALDLPTESHDGPAGPAHTAVAVGSHPLSRSAASSADPGVIR